MKLINNFLGKILLYISVLILKRNRQFNLKFLAIEKIIIDKNSINKPVNPILLNALICIEDKRFHYHKGVDFISILRAAYKTIFSKRIEGASTLTQQLVRVITNEREITIKRKLYEIFFSCLIDYKFSKVQIFNAYLLVYEFSNFNGIDKLCRKEKYDFQNLSKQDCVELAARFKFPNLSSQNYIRYLKRVRTIEKKLSPKLYKHNAQTVSKPDSMVVCNA